MTSASEAEQDVRHDALLALAAYAASCAQVYPYGVPRHADSELPHHAAALKKERLACVLMASHAALQPLAPSERALLQNIVEKGIGVPMASVSLDEVSGGDGGVLSIDQCQALRHKHTEARVILLFGAKLPPRFQHPAESQDQQGRFICLPDLGAILSSPAAKREAWGQVKLLRALLET